MKNILKTILAVNLLIFALPTLADDCFVKNMECMFEQFKVPDEQLQYINYPLGEDKVSPAYSPNYGLLFINPNNSKQVVFKFKLGKFASYYLKHNRNFTVDIDLVSHGRTAQIANIKHNIPEVLATGDTSFMDNPDKPVSTLFLTFPRNLNPDKTAYVIFEFERSVANLEHHISWQLGYDTDIFESAGLAAHLQMVKNTETSYATYLVKKSLIKDYVQFKRGDCMQAHTEDACESFVLKTDSTYNVDKDSFVLWSNQKFSTNYSASSARKRLLGKVADTAKTKVTDTVYY